MKILVAHYSRSGSNRYLAERTAAALEADMEQIRPEIDIYPLMLLGTWMGFGAGIRKPEHDPADYGRVILIAPVYLGKFALPAQQFIRRYSSRVSDIICVTCCGSTYEKRNEKFGYEGAFRHIRKLASRREVRCEAFSKALVIPGDKQDDSEAFMSTTLTDDNFKGEILEKFNSFISEARMK
jgi:menaquinone-dependent protoporphyrinogen IX oxidase